MYGMTRQSAPEYTMHRVSSGEDCEITKRDWFFKGANGSNIKHHGQRRLRVKTSAGSNMNTTWEAVAAREVTQGRTG